MTANAYVIARIDQDPDGLPPATLITQIQYTGFL